MNVGSLEDRAMLTAEFGFAGGFGATMTAGGGFDHGQAVATDSAGNSYFTGEFFGTADFDPGSGVTNLASAGDQDIFVTKFDGSGNLLWARRIGGSGSDIGFGIDIDSAGNVLVSGRFAGTVDFDPGSGTHNLTASSVSQAFVLKLDTNGD